MENLKQYTASLLVILASCGSDDQLPPQDNVGLDDPLPIVQTKDAVTEDMLLGTWEIELYDGDRVQKGDKLFGMKQAFLPEHVWVIGKGFSTDTSLVTGGRWTFDPNAKQINALFLPDSISETVILVDLNSKKMEVETNSGIRQTWRKTKPLPDSLLVLPKQ